MKTKLLSAYRAKILVLICIAFSCNYKAIAQTSYEDSLFFTTVFQTPVYLDYYQFPGKFYVHPFVTTRAALFDSLDNLMKFSGEEFYGSYDKTILGNLYPVDSINNSLNYYYSLNPLYGYRQTDPVWGLPFSLNGKKTTTYCTYTPTTNSNRSTSCTTAVLFITGSGTNNGTEMAQGVGYQNKYGFMKDSLATIGDVYIGIRPLIDFRGFVWDRPNNPAALNSEFPIPNQITSYLLSRNTPYGANALIESIALVKYLKSKYQRVVLAGLSYGGIYTTLNSFESEPEGALVSGGYTITVDQTSENNNYQVASFGPLFYALNRDSVKNNIGKSTTEFLFSWGHNGDIYEETNLHLTQNYFAGLNNTQYFYDYDDHTYPPFRAFKNLFDSVNQHATVRIKEIEKTCSLASSKIRIAFCGQGPYHFDLYKDSVLYHSYTTGDDTTITITEAGVYKVRNLFDSKNISGYNSDNYIFKPNDNISVELTKQNWLCNGVLKNEFKLTGGTGPWDVYYRENGVSKSLVFNTDDLLEFSWSDGTYIIDSINNYGNCMKFVNDTVRVNSKIVEPEQLFASVFFNADSAKVQLVLKDYFNYYKKLYFLKDGIKDSVDIKNNMILLPGGDYQFTGIADDLDCIFPLNLPAYVNSDADRFSITSILPQLSAYPNPFTRQFNVVIKLPSDQVVVLDIFNSLGQKVKSLKVIDGLNIIDMQGFKKGIYFLKLRYKVKGYSFDTLKMIMQ